MSDTKTLLTDLVLENQRLKQQIQYLSLLLGGVALEASNSGKVDITRRAIEAVAKDYRLELKELKNKIVLSLIPLGDQDK